MLVGRGMRVTNTEAVGRAYAVASNDLHRSGAIAEFESEFKAEVA